MTLGLGKELSCSSNQERSPSQGGGEEASLEVVVTNPTLSCLAREQTLAVANASLLMST